MKKALQNYMRRLQATSLRGFSIAEVLIAIVIITILTIGSISVYSAQMQKARDTERKNDVDRIRGYLDEIVGRFGTPPGEDASRKLDDVPGCAEPDDLFTCFKSLQMSTEDDLIAVLEDPREEVPNDRADDNRAYEYYYGSTANSYRVCAMFEDQGAVDLLNYQAGGEEEIDGDFTGQDDFYCIDFLQPGGDPVATMNVIKEPDTSS